MPHDHDHDYLSASGSVILKPPRWITHSGVILELVPSSFSQFQSHLIPMYLDIQAIATICFTGIAMILIRWVHRRQKMPPGPSGLPIIGNRHEVPARKPWRKFAEWNKQYGKSIDS